MFPRPYLQQMPAAVPDEAIDQAGRQIREFRRLGIGHPAEHVEPAQQIPGHVLLKARQHGRALAGGKPAEDIPDLLHLKHRLRASPAGQQLGLDVGQDPAEVLGAIDRDQGGTLGERRQPPLDALDDRLLDLVMNRKE
jgi:hypothetical protein